MCLSIVGMCVISVVVAQINFTTTDHVCGKIGNLPQSVFRGISAQACANMPQSFADMPQC